jgi:hypothetical protein
VTLIRAAALCAALAGCAPPARTVPVSGAVTLDGRAFGNGGDAVIRFDPADPAKGNSAESFVTGGKYAVELVPGRYRVSVTWTRPTGKTRTGVAGPGADAGVSEQVIPARYNTATELTADVSADRPTHDFGLTSR